VECKEAVSNHIRKYSERCISIGARNNATRSLANTPLLRIHPVSRLVRACHPATRNPRTGGTHARIPM